MPKTPVFVGVDVACAKGKRLPVCVAARIKGRLEPRPIPDGESALSWTGKGNIEVKEDDPFGDSAKELVDALRRAADAEGWDIASVAIDAPAAPPRKGCRRKSEEALTSFGLSSFRTPDCDQWLEIKRKCRRHLEGRKPPNRLPYANKIWMLYGFKLYEAFRATGQKNVIEVYPYAIVRAVAGDCRHKTTPEGYSRQLAAVAKATGWAPVELDGRLRQSVVGARHDRLDAFMAAWVASLDKSQRRAYGDETNPNDAIWVPRNEALVSPRLTASAATRFERSTSGPPGTPR